MDQARHLRALAYLLTPPSDEISRKLARLADEAPERGFALLPELGDALEPRIPPLLEEACNIQRLRALWIVVGAHSEIGHVLRTEVARLAKDWQRAEDVPSRRAVVHEILAWYSRRRTDIRFTIRGRPT